MLLPNQCSNAASIVAFHWSFSTLRANRFTVPAAELTAAMFASWPVYSLTISIVKSRGFCANALAALLDELHCLYTISVAMQ